MNTKRQLFLVWPMLVVANVTLGFWDGWRARDFISLGIVALIGVALVFVLRAQRS